MAYPGICGCTTNYWIDVAAGNIPGAAPFSFFGERPSATNDTNGEDVWPGVATVIPFPPDVGEQMTLVSTSVQDDAVGTGIRTAMLHYLDASGNEQTETIIMDGTTPVDTVATNIRFVQHIHALTVGSNGVAVGTISIYKFGSASTIYSVISAGGNMALTCSRMVPAGKTLYITEWNASQGKNQTVAIRLRATSDGTTVLPGVFLFKDTRVLQTAPSSGTLNPPLMIPALAVVKVSLWASSNGAHVGASIIGLLIDN